VGAVGVKILAFPLTWHIAYTTACCYHTSRDNSKVYLNTSQILFNFLEVLILLAMVAKSLCKFLVI